MSGHDDRGGGEGDAPNSLRRSLRLVTITGCLAMIYGTAVSSPAAANYFHDLGATDFHFSLLGGLPLIMLSFQFVGAALASRLRRRKPMFLVTNVIGRLMYIPIAFLPLLLGKAAPGAVVPALLVLIALANACANLISPLWLSWMGDLIPRRRLTTFWGQRHSWMHVTWTLCYLAITAFTYKAGLSPRATFEVLAVTGCLVGVCDVLLYIWVREPEPDRPADVPLGAQLLAPLRDRGFRAFLVFSCFWQASISWAASFMQIYVLKVLEIPVWQTTLIWCAAGFGGIVASRNVGRLADRHGNRPLLVISVSLKSMIVIVYLFLTPGSTLWVLPIAFLFDSMLNSLLVLATTGYLLKSAPSDNRAMFVAAMTGLAGICGGLGAMASGAFLEWTAGMSWTVLGRNWSHYQLMFGIGVLLRWGCILLVRRIREPQSSHSAEVLEELHNVWPFQVFLFPLALGRRFLRLWDDDDTDHDVHA